MRLETANFQTVNLPKSQTIHEMTSRIRFMFFGHLTFLQSWFVGYFTSWKLAFSPLVSQITKANLNSINIIIKQVASFKLSLFVKNYLQRTQTLQLILIGNYLQK
jgi:hypothetical protein